MDPAEVTAGDHRCHQRTCRCAHHHVGAGDIHTQPVQPVQVGDLPRHEHDAAATEHQCGAGSGAMTGPERRRHRKIVVGRSGGWGQGVRRTGGGHWHTLLHRLVAGRRT